MKDNLYDAVENACENLPDGFKIEIYLERNSGCVSLTDPNGDEHDFPSNRENMVDEVNDAVEHAKELDSKYFATLVSLAGSADVQSERNQDAD